MYDLLFQVYPKRDITNIVEASHYQKVSNWCKVGHKKCKGTHSEWVKPYRCLGELHYLLHPLWEWK
jgi:amyloid beta A4 protein